MRAVTASLVIVLVAGCATSRSDRTNHKASAARIVEGTLTVSGHANIFGAGHAVAPNPGGAGGGSLPPMMPLPANTNLVVVFADVAGSVRMDSNEHPQNANGPDGGTLFFRTDVTSADGIAGIINDRKTLFLTGVFLDDNHPAGTPPERLDFSAGRLTERFTTLAPELRQTFFIGDGRTGTGQGAWQRFIVPAGATRLYLGFSDAWDGSTVTGKPGWYGDNDGSLTAQALVLPADALQILAAPTNRTVVTGSDVVLEVVATGPAPLKYQWFRYGTRLTGENQSALTFPLVSARDAGLYKVMVTDANGRSAETQPVRLVVRPMTLESRVEALESVSHQPSALPIDTQALERELSDSIRAGNYFAALECLQEKWLAEKIQLGATNAQTLATLRRLADFSGCFADWGRCASASRELTALAGYDPLVMRGWAVAAWLDGDRSAYRTVCSRMLAASAHTTNGTIAERTAKTCLLSPDAAGNLKQVLGLADVVVNIDTNFVWIRLVKGMAELRARRPESALRWLAPVLGSRETHAAMAAGYTASMAHQSLQHTNRAQVILTEANRRMDVFLQEGSLAADNWERWWFDAAASMALRYEAEKLILGRPMAAPLTTASLAAARKDWWIRNVKLSCAYPAELIRPKAWKASWSPDSQRLVFGKHGGGIAIMDLASQKVSDLVPQGQDPAWSPDGKWIAYVKEPNEAYLSEQVWLVSATGGEPVKVGDGGFPTWSADSRQVIFHSRKLNQILSAKVGALDEPPAVFFEKPLSWYPAISPDGSRIAFGVANRLVVVERATGEELASLATPGERGALPCWSPDGRRVAFGGFAGSRAGLWIFDVERGGAFQVAKNPGCTMPAWSPDGEKLAFDLRGKPNEIWLLKTKFLPREPGLVKQLPGLPAQPAVKRETTEPPLVGKPAPGPFTLSLLDGGELVLPDTSRTNVLLLDFWASWCGPCRQVMPALEKIAKEFAPLGVRYVAVNLREQPDVIRSYLAKAGLNITVARDVDGKMGEAFHVLGIPTMVIIDQQGIVRKVHVGASPNVGDELREALFEILPMKPAGEAIAVPMPKPERGLEL